MKLDNQEALKRVFGPTPECLAAEELNAWMERGDSQTQGHLEVRALRDGAGLP